MIFFRLSRLGREHMPSGGLILAANHRSFLDPFIIGCCLRRPIYFVAKQELFENRLQGWFLNCLAPSPSAAASPTRSRWPPRSRCSSAARRW